MKTLLTLSVLIVALRVQASDLNCTNGLKVEGSTLTYAGISYENCSQGVAGKDVFVQCGTEDAIIELTYTRETNGDITGMDLVRFDDVKIVETQRNLSCK